jgi:uncharacterized Zn finger protein
MPQIPQPSCPKCQSELTLKRVLTGAPGFDFHTFECPICAYVHKTLVALVDPMKSVETRGWLQGLQAPS